MTVFPLPNPSLPHEYVSFFDETCTTGHDYMVMGGVLCKAEFGLRLSHQIESIKSDRGRSGSLQWKNLSRRNTPKYRSAVRTFFESNREQHIDFCAIVLKCSQFDHNTYNRGSWDQGFNKFMFQFFFRWLRIYGRLSSFRCFPDQRSSAQDLSKLKDILNASAQKRYTTPRWIYTRSPFIEVKYSRTRSENLLQISDILLGAIGHAWNDKHAANPNGHKAAMSEFIREQAGLPSLARPTDWPDRHFSIWEFDLSAINRSPWA